MDDVKIVINHPTLPITFKVKFLYIFDDARSHLSKDLAVSEDKCSAL